MVIKAAQNVGAGDVEFGGMSGSLKIRPTGGDAVIRINRQTIKLYQDDPWLELTANGSKFEVVSGNVDYIID